MYRFLLLVGPSGSHTTWGWRKLYGVIQGLHAKLLQTKLEKQKQFSNLKSQAQINLKKSFKKVENLTEENSALRNDLNELQKKLAHLIANNNVLNQEYDKSMRNTENDLHMILESKDTHIRKLTQDVLNLQNELKIKGCEYKKKKQIYCKIIVKLRNQLKLINGNVFDKLKDASDKNFCFSKEEMEPYLKSMKNLKFDEIPIGNEILHKLPKL